INEHLCAVCGGLRYIIKEDRFIADKDANACAVQVKDFALCAPRKVTDLTSQFVGKKQQTLERHIFAKRHQMNLVIAAKRVAAWIHDQSRVQKLLLPTWRFCFTQAAHDKIRMSVLGQDRQPVL